MAIQSAAEFRAAAAKKRKTVEVEIEGVGAVRLRALSAGDAQRFQSEVQKAVKEGGDSEELAFALIARSWVDAENNLWLPEDEGIEMAKSLDPDTYNAVAKAVLVLNGLAEDSVDVAVKNSEASRDESTPTGSPAISDTPTSI